MTTILLSIKPEYVRGILKGTKTVELRKVKPRVIPDKIVIYETAPTKAIVAVVDVKFVATHLVATIWKTLKNRSGISKDDFDSYFAGRDTGVVFGLGEVKPLRPHERFSLGMMRLAYPDWMPPQSFRYVDDDWVRHMQLCQHLTTPEILGVGKSSNRDTIVEGEQLFAKAMNRLKVVP